MAGLAGTHQPRRPADYTGPSVWHRDHYRPCMTELRASRGPFAGCTKGEHQIAHRLPGRVPSTWYLDADD